MLQQHYLGSFLNILDVIMGLQEFLTQIESYLPHQLLMWP
jgi:hypothetical protein